MSQPSLASQPGSAGVPVQKQKTNIYTMMLILSFVCVVIACLLLWMELRRWGAYPWWKTDEGKPTAPQASVWVPCEPSHLPTYFA